MADFINNPFKKGQLGAQRGATHTPLGVRLPRMPRALAVLTGINLCISVLLWLLAGADALFGLHLDSNYMRPVDWLTLPASITQVAARPWCVLTYMFTQVSVLHLLFNMLWLYWFGLFLSQSCRQRTLVWLYIAGGLCGALLFLIASPATGFGLYSICPHLTGASASVLAIMAAVGCRQPNRRITLLIFGRCRMIVVVIVAMTLTFIGGDLPDNADTLAAHLGGALCGLAWGLYPRLQPGKLRDTIKRARHKQRIKSHARSAAEIFNAADISDRSINASRSRADNRQRLDNLLDKIRTSGYDSLSNDERRELEMLSKNI